MTPKQNSQVAKCIKFLLNTPGTFLVPSAIVYEAKAEITSETLARKLRAYSKGDNPIIHKGYYRTTNGNKVATYGLKIC